MIDMDEATKKLMKKMEREFLFLKIIHIYIPTAFFIIAFALLLYYGQNSITLCWHDDIECLESIDWEE